MSELVRHYRGSARKPMDKFLATLDFKFLVTFLREFRCPAEIACATCTASTENTYSAHLINNEKNFLEKSGDKCLFTACLNKCLKSTPDSRYIYGIRFERYIPAQRTHYGIRLWGIRGPLDRGDLKFFLRKHLNLTEFLFTFLPIWDNIKHSRHVGDRL